jgi:hypothetical protein
MDHYTKFVRKTQEQNSAKTRPVSKDLKAKWHIPQPRLSLVTRPRLGQPLDGRPRQGQWLSLVSGLAGFFARRRWLPSGLRRRATDVAWLPLHEGGNNPVQFFDCLLAVMQQADPPVGQAVVRLLDSRQSLSTLTLPSRPSEGRVTACLTFPFECGHVLWFSRRVHKRGVRNRRLGPPGEPAAGASRFAVADGTSQIQVPVSPLRTTASMTFMLATASSKGVGT